MKKRMELSVPDSDLRQHEDRSERVRYSGYTCLSQMRIRIHFLTRLFHLSFELGVPFPYPCQCGMGGNTIIGNQCVTNISNLNFSHF